MTKFISESFTPQELSTACSIAHNAAELVAPTLKANFGVSEYSTKSNERDWVTQWDNWAEEKIKALLERFSTGVSFMGEENGVDINSEVYWTIDAIDGTSHFVRGNDLCTTMVSLVDNGVPVVSCIFDFVRNNSYTAIAGQGAFKDLAKPIIVSTRPINTAYLEIYTDEDTPDGKALRESIEAAGAYLLRNASTGYTMLSVACGRTEGFVSLRNPYATDWDLAPGALLIHEAGGVVVNVGKDTYRLDDYDFIAANQPTFSVLNKLVLANK